MKKFQNKVWDRLYKSFSTMNIANAYIFSGPAGSGKENIAIQFSKLLNCENPSRYSCQECPSCLRIKKLQHENLKLIFPLPTPVNKSKNSSNSIDKKNIETINELISKKANDGFFKIKVNSANRILINSIRDLRKNIYLKSNNNGRKIILIFDSHLLSSGQGEAANALLKLLEEPPKNTSFILVTDHFNLLLTTITSRCQNITFPKLNNEFIQEWLSSNTELMNDIPLFLGLSNGNMHLAKKTMLLGKKEIHNLINNSIKTLISKDSLLWRNFTQLYSKLSKEDRSIFTLHLTILKIWFQSTYRLTKNIKHPLQETELKVGMERFIGRYKDVDYPKIILEIEHLEGSVSQNLFMPLSITNFILKVQKSFNYR